MNKDMDDVVDAAGAVGENLNIDKMDQVQDTVTEINSNKTFDASNLTGLFFQVKNLLISYFNVNIKLSLIFASTLENVTPFISLLFALLI